MEHTEDKENVTVSATSEHSPLFSVGQEVFYFDEDGAQKGFISACVCINTQFYYS